MRKLLAAVLLVTLFASVCLAKTPDNDIVILFTNDVHCGVDENIGYAGLMAYKMEVEKLTPYVTLVDAGDWAQGGTIGAISQGRYILEIMNAMGYEFAVPGNHEFDYGWSQFENYVKNLKCEFYLCNLRDLRTGELLFKPYKIFTYGDIKVALVGASTPESLVKSTPSTFMDEDGKYIYDFDGEQTGEKLIASIQKAVDSARSEGADYVIVVGHLGEYDDTPEVWSAPFIAARTRNIDAFIDGHSHEVTPGLHIKNLDGKDVVITQTGTKLINIGKVTIKKDGAVTTELINKVDSKDPKIEAVINDIKARYEDTLKKVLTHTSFELHTYSDDKYNWLVRIQETNMGDLITDSLLASAKETKTGKADIAFINAGGVRADINAGDITFGDAFNVLPFNNTVCIVEASGQTILDELEMSGRLLPNKSGGFFQVAGMKYTVDTTIPTPVQLDDKNNLIGISGERRVKDVTINGQAIDPEKLYKVVGVSYFLREGGDGHMFKGAKLIEPDYATLLDAFAHYLKTFENLPEEYEEPQGRITIIK